MWDVFTRFGDEDAFSLATRVWFTDVGFAFFGSGKRLEVVVTVKKR